MTEQKELLLIQQVAQRDSAALEQLFQKYLPMIRHLLMSYNLSIYDEEDWLQEARLVCFRACVTYNPERGSVFSAYYKRCFQNRINSIMRHELAYKRRSNQYCASTDEKPQLLANLISEGNPQQAQMLKQDLQQYHLELSPYEKLCFQVMMGNRTLESVMAETDTTYPQAYRAMDRCRMKFQRFIRLQARRGFFL